MSLPGTFAPLLGAASIPSVIYQTEADSSVSNTTYTFSSLALGAASPSRHIAVAVTKRTPGVPSTFSVTVAGIAATSVVELNDAYSGGTRLGLFIVAVPTGTTGNVVVTNSTTCSRCAVAVWAVYNLTSATAVATATATNAATSGPASLNINTTPGGIIIAASDYGITSTATAWVGVTENFDVVFTENFSGGSFQTTTTETPRTITATFSAGAVDSWAAASAFFK